MCGQKKQAAKQQAANKCKAPDFVKGRRKWAGSIDEMQRSKHAFSVRDFVWKRVDHEEQEICGQVLHTHRVWERGSTHMHSDGRVNKFKKGVKDREREVVCVCMCVWCGGVCVQGSKQARQNKNSRLFGVQKKMLATTTHKELDEIRAGRVFAEFIPREDGSLCALLQ